MITKYKAKNYGSGVIERIDVVRETASCVFYTTDWYGSIEERKASKNSTSECYFDTWEEAHQWLLELAESGLVSARRQLELAQSRHGNVKGMKPPQESGDAR